MRGVTSGCECDRFGAVECTSCRICEPVCPTGLDLARVVATSRLLRGPDTSHQGLFGELASLEAQGATARIGEWHGTLPGVRTGEDVVFFPGTAALMDPFFERDTEYAAGPHAAMLLLNAAGLGPKVVGGGSGHDLWYGGRLDEFKALGERLVPRLEEAIAAVGKGPVVCASAEDAHALADLHGVEAVHISEFLAGRDLDLPGVEEDRPRVAFLDPCRLGRIRGIYDAPRTLLELVAEVVDLGWPRGEEPCCGVSAWVNCNAWSKDHRESILRRAHEAGIDALVTGCPMCQVHLDCYYSEPGYDEGDSAVVPPLRVVDISVLVAEQGGLLSPDRERLEWPMEERGTGTTGLLLPVDRRPVDEWLAGPPTTAAHLCTLCLRCVHECPQDAPVLEHVLRVRRGLWDNGIPAEGMEAMVTSIAREGNPFGEPREGRTEAYPPSMARRVLGDEDRTPDVLVFPGCVYSYQDPRALAALAKVLEAAGLDYAVMGDEEGCCGYMDHLAGAEEEFQEMARGLMGRVVATGARALVTPCAGCFRTLSQLYTEVDEGWPGQLEVLHAVELIDRLLEEDRLIPQSDGKVRMVAYHDPCDLGRQCGVYDPPRRVVAALPGVVLEEFPASRTDAECCGGGGGLRTFDAGKSMDVGRRRLESLVEGIDMVATSCISCKGNMRLAAARLARDRGPRLRVGTVVELVASYLDGGDGR
ncbi:MAG: (Fe-S)-binding protein [Thermoplasmata archaeon]|nr:MAG: (Fe-S)-binding protein [Thermoplasmata archaeon]